MVLKLPIVLDKINMLLVFLFPKRNMDCKPDGRRRTGRPKLRRIDGVLEDIKKLGLKNW